MVSCRKLPFSFDSEQLNRDLEVAGTSWMSHFNTSYFSGDWSGIALRAPLQSPGISPDICPGDVRTKSFEDTPTLKNLQYTQSVLESIRCPKLSIRYLKLGAGSEIVVHKDYDLVYWDGYVRLHIPIVTNPQVEFIVGEDLLEMKAGECWFVDFTQKHSVKNNGTTDRIHLVIDCQVNKWLDCLFREIGVLGKLEEKPDPLDKLDKVTKEDMVHRLTLMNTETSLKMADDIRKKYLR